MNLYKNIYKPSIQRQSAEGLTIGEPDDQYEKEADQVANQVMRMSEGDAPIQRKCTQCEEEEVMQRKEANGVPNIQADFNTKLQGSKGGGTTLPGNTQQFMESRMGADFSNVRIHTGNISEKMNRDISARAFTHGSDIYFNQNEYQPESSSGKELLAHELTHVVQQKGNRIQRAIAEEDIAGTSVNSIFSDETYFENGITRIQFFDAQLAILHYADGSQIRVGLVPDQLDTNVPIQGVDYLTSSSTHIRFNPQRTGQVQFIPRGTEIVPRPGATFGEVERDFSQSITFMHDQGSGRIVPSIVNTLTAPRLCEVLQRARSQYSRQMDEMAAGMVETLEVMEWVVILASLLPSGGTSSTASGTRAAGGAAAATTGVMGRATSRLSRLFSRLLRTGSTEAMAVVEGVEFHTVRVAMSESQLVITRFGIRNASRVGGQGRLVHAAYERAAIAAAREAGATSVSIRMQTVINAGWRTYLESQGYAMQMIERADGFSNLLVKVITL